MITNILETWLLYKKCPNLKEQNYMFFLKKLSVI